MGAGCTKATVSDGVRSEQSAADSAMEELDYQLLQLKDKNDQLVNQIKFYRGQAHAQGLRAVDLLDYQDSAGAMSQMAMRNMSLKYIESLSAVQQRVNEAIDLVRQYKASEELRRYLEDLKKQIEQYDIEGLMEYARQNTLEIQQAQANVDFLNQAYAQQQGVDVEEEFERLRRAVKGECEDEARSDQQMTPQVAQQQEIAPRAEVFA